MTTAEHQPVLHKEVLSLMAVQADGHYIDGTYGRGGHAASILQNLDERGRLIVMDRDPQAISSAHQRFDADARVSIVHDDYANMENVVREFGLSEQINGILLDLGVSSPQLDNAERGFSFQSNGPLDMRMDTTRGETAADWLAREEEAEIARVLWEYGEERQSRRIARRIVEQRQQQAITDTASLAALIEQVLPRSRNPKHRAKHPATRSFQAIRIHINRELEQLQQFLDSVFDILAIGGRLLIISFHSLEDRLVKRFFKQQSTAAKLPRGLPLRDDELKTPVRMKLLSRAIKAGDLETSDNPRSRSAVLRVAERLC